MHSQHNTPRNLDIISCLRSALVSLLLLSPLCSTCQETTANALPDREAYVTVSKRDPRYFELSNGRPWIPIGLNMIAPAGRDLSSLIEWMDQLAHNRGNYIRVWLGHAFFDVESERSGEYQEAKAERIGSLIRLARARNIRVKLCLESFRHFGTRNQRWSEKSLHLVANGGTARDIADFFDGNTSRARFRGKLEWYQDRIGQSPTIFGWELWNEINAVAGGDYMAWTEAMLPELHRLFPRNLAMQSLGSFDRAGNIPDYRRLTRMAGNDVAQVHRYLDLGADLDVCHGPVDVLAADAVRTLLDWDPNRPVLLAESGAVEPSHSGPFRLYTSDREGILLHDVLFAPFFAGAAGPGHTWHWDSYVARMNLWHHFDRFAEVVRDLDPAAEHFTTATVPHPRLRIYVLKGRRTTLLWCRDQQNTWQTELADGRAPELLQNLQLEADTLSLDEGTLTAYDPWENRWQRLSRREDRVQLPDFRRSIIVKKQLD